MIPKAPMRTSILKIAVVFSAALTVVSCAALLYLYGYRYLAGDYLTIEMRASVPGHGQVFFDTGSDYNENDSHRFAIKSSSGFEKYIIPLPEKKVKSIRFDPIDRRGLFEIRSLTLVVKGMKVVWKGDQLAKQIDPQQQINIIHTDIVFAGSSTGEDPIFYVKGFAVPGHPDFFPHPVFFIVAFTIVMTLLGLMFYRLMKLFIRLCRPHVLGNSRLANLWKLLSFFVRPLFMPLREISGLADKFRRLWDIKWIRYTSVFLFLILWGRVVWSIFLDHGLFGWIGTDFALYYAQSTALWSGDPSAIYKPEVFDPVFQGLLDQYSPGHPEIRPTHVPYPPLFAWLFTLFTLPSPPLGYALWGGLNLLAVIHLSWRISQLFPRIRHTWATFLVLFSFPFAYSLILGQPQILLASAVSECYRSLQGRRDFWAGLWLSFLLFKPQYGILVGLFLIWKRRWAAIAGAVVGGIAVVGGSVLVAGVDTLLDYPKSLTEMSRFYSWDMAHMINWRSLVFMLCSFFPETIGEHEGMMITLSLAYITVLITAFAWRGEWLPGRADFPVRFTLLLLATLLANHHSFCYGAVILALPLAAALATGDHYLLTGMSVVAGVMLPTLSFTIFKFADVAWASRILTFSLLALYGSLLIWLWQYNKRVAVS